jgi:hypothetical protein
VTYLQPEDADFLFLQPVQVHLAPQLHCPSAQLLQSSPHLGIDRQQLRRERCKVVLTCSRRKWAEPCWGIPHRCSWSTSSSCRPRTFDRNHRSWNHKFVLAIIVEGNRECTYSQDLD